MSEGWPGTRVLVTGAGGFIGSHLVGRLVRQGADVRAFLRYNSRSALGALRSEPEVDEVELHFGDLRDSDAVTRAVCGCEVVFHLGALIAVPYSYIAPRDVVDVNVGGTMNVLSAARDLDVERLVHVSTSEVYGDSGGQLITEDTAVVAKSPYAASKLGAEMLARSFHHSYGVAVGVVRPFNTYGPRQSPRAVIPAIISQALADQTVKIGSRHPVRDFTFVDDTVEGMMAFAAWADASGQMLNLGSGIGVSIDDVLQIVEGVLGRELRVETDARRVRTADAEVNHLLCDASLAERALGWRASVSVRDGVARTVDWMAANPDWYGAREYAV